MGSTGATAADTVVDGGDEDGSGTFELIEDSCEGSNRQPSSVILALMDAVVQDPLPENADEDVTGCSLLLVVVAVTGTDTDVRDALEVQVDGLLT